MTGYCVESSRSVTHAGPFFWAQLYIGVFFLTQLFGFTPHHFGELSPRWGLGQGSCSAEGSAMPRKKKIYIYTYIYRICFMHLMRV